MGQVDIKGIKTAIKVLLDTANTTTASINLSDNLADKVVKVGTFSLEKLFLNANEIPGIAVYTDNKQPNQETIARSMASGKRGAELNLFVAGAVYVPYTADDTEDPADNDCEYLMENIEEIIRDSDTLSDTVQWAMPTGITYHTMANREEQSHYRIGLMSLKCRVFY